VGFWVPALFMREFGRGMAERGYGVIFNISSSAALRARPFLAHYSALKAAADMVMRTTAMELGRHNVRALSIAPGAIDTQHHGVTDKRATETPLDMMGQPGDIGRLAVFLASDEARFMTGSVVTCDGGTNAGEYSRYEPFRAAMLKARQA
jgi:NAD(P)-dependent dehydrogenase (short-subunit alcohol dehydrogenase family)